MSRLQSKSLKKKITEDLYERVLNGEKIQLKEIVSEYFNPKDSWEKIVAVRQVRSMFNSIRIRLQKEGYVVGSLGESRVFGIPTTREEYEYMGLTRWALVKGIVNQSERIMRSGQDLGLISPVTKTVKMLTAPIEE